ncbi:uncharacterized protein SRS1_14533 [Sporisorium reilianum f. sp. reilianum]|uniref:Uncharacterized protein n=1 Tax=Sporisorium reilianum f. sp. reilianum TaxID=72559 RepID=A0A2N8UFN1_9BASI|nr:uncharacterized protein SRS1_14533 [Sporisorium reilianum f. sp. reilianum]
MSEPQQNLWATVQHHILTFPAFVHLPASARPESQHLLASNNVESVKCISLSTEARPRTVYLNPSTGVYETLYPHVSYKSQIAFRWGIDPNIIRALVVNVDGNRVLIEDKDDWGDWISTFFFRSLIRSPSYNSQRCQEFIVSPVHIHVVVDVPDQQQTATTSAAPANAPPAYQPQDEPLLSRQTLTASTEAAPSGAPASVNALVNNVVGTVLQTLQPQLQALPQSILSSLSASMAAANSHTASSAGTVPAAFATTVQTPVPTNASRETANATHRQSLIDGLFDELSRLRAQPASASAAQPSPPTAVADDAASITEAGTTMSNELGQAFAEMLARQRAAASTSASDGAAAAVGSSGTTAPATDEDDESLTIISTPSSSSRRASRSRSRSGRRTLLSSTTLLLLALVTCILGLVAPAAASPHISALNPRTAATPLVAPRQNSRHLHLCKCTCFQTNSTLVPLYAPKDKANPCLTCTRQFCLDQGLDMCKGAKLEHTDHDVGTGLEGDVWAKCFERDSYKDQSIITLYILVVVGLVAFAAMRGRMEGWYQQYQSMGPQGLYNAVRESPWRRSSR